MTCSRAHQKVSKTNSPPTVKPPRIWWALLTPGHLCIKCISINAEIIFVQVSCFIMFECDPCGDRKAHLRARDYYCLHHRHAFAVSDLSSGIREKTNLLFSFDGRINFAPIVLTLILSVRTLMDHGVDTFTAEIKFGDGGLALTSRGSCRARWRLFVSVDTGTRDGEEDRPQEPVRPELTAKGTL